MNAGGECGCELLASDAIRGIRQAKRLPPESRDSSSVAYTGAREAMRDVDFLLEGKLGEDLVSLNIGCCPP